MKIFKYIMLTLLAIILILGLGLYIFFNTAPQIGKAAKGERLERMKSASNYEDGVFVNAVETNMDMSWSTLKKVLKERFSGDSKAREPQQEITTTPFNKESFLASDSVGFGFTWFGHSTLLLRIAGKTILIDPVLVGERTSMFSFLGPKRFSYDHYVGLDEFPPIDIVLISHDHYDHLDYPTIRDLANVADRFMLPIGVGAHVEHWGVPSEKIYEYNWWQEEEFDGLSFVFTPTRHFSGRAILDRFKTLWGSWVITSASSNIYYSGDSGYFPGFKRIGEKYGPFDMTFMECGAYNEGWSNIHMFPEETAQAHIDLGGKLLVPIHWGKFDLSLHPWKESVERLTKKAIIENVELVTPQVGQLVLVPDGSGTSRWWESYQ